MGKDTPLKQAVALPGRGQCLSHRLLKWRLQPDDETLEGLNEDLKMAQQAAIVAVTKFRPPPLPLQACRDGMNRLCCDD